MLISPKKITTTVRDYINHLSIDELKDLLLKSSDIKEMEAYFNDIKLKEEYRIKQSKNLKEILNAIYPKESND